jgi:hypothetical protein
VPDGLATINLRRPLGARRAFTSVARFQGAKVNVVTSRISEDILRAPSRHFLVA